MAINPLGNPMNGVSHSDFVNNAQHVGMQKTAVNKNDEEDASSFRNITDQAQLSLTEGPKAGAQTGMAQEAGKGTSTEKASEDKAQKDAGKTDPESQDAEQGQNLPALLPEHKNLPVPVSGGQNLPVPVTQPPSFDAGMPGSNLGSSPDAGAAPAAGAPGASSGADPNQGAGPFVGASPGMTSEEYLAKMQQAQQESEKLQEIMLQMFAERQKHMMKLWQIMQDLNTHIYETMQATAAARYKSTEFFANKWAAVLGGYDR